jgi:hypothetical protein
MRSGKMARRESPPAFIRALRHSFAIHLRRGEKYPLGIVNLLDTR